MIEGDSTKTWDLSATMHEPAISRLQSGGLITNYVCSSACAHCSYRSSPKRDKAYITAPQAAENFRICRRLGCRSMHIGGGEPLLKPDALKEVLRAARQEGMGIDYVETNSSWFRDQDSAVALLRDLQQLGCGTLLISIDPFHNEFIPFAKVKGVLQACRRSGMGIFPWVMEFYDEINRLDDRTTHSLEEYEQAYGPGYLADVEARYWVSMCGRAVDTFGPLHPRQDAEQILGQANPSCQKLVGTGHFHIDLYGNYVPPGCVGLTVRRDDLGSPLARESYPIFRTLLEGGVAALYSLAQEFGYEPGREFAGECDLCAQLRSFLVGRAPDRFPELAPAEFYTVDQ
jgi:hypothetical protein